MEGDTEDKPDSEGESAELERVRALLDRAQATASIDDFGILMKEAQDSSITSIPAPELTGLLDELWSLFSQIKLPASGRSTGLDLTASAWLGIAYRQAHAVAVLAKGDLLDTAVANARSAFEHAIYLSLIADGRDYAAVLDALEGKLHKTWRHAIHDLEDVEAVMLPYIENLEAKINVPHDMSWVRSVEHVCNRLRTGDNVYRHYRMLSAFTHAGLGSTIPYLYNAPKSDGRPTAPLPVFDQTILSIAVGSCIWAGWSIDQLFQREMFGPSVAKAAERLGYIPLTRIKD